MHRCFDPDPGPNPNPNPNPDPDPNPSPNPNPNPDQVRIAALKRREDTKKLTQAASNQAVAAGAKSPQSPPPSPPESPRNSGFDGKRNSRVKAAKEAKERSSDAKEGEEGEGESRRRHRKSRASRDSAGAEPGESPIASRGASITMLPTAAVSFEPDAKKDTSACTPGSDTSAHYQTGHDHQKGPNLNVASMPLQKANFTALGPSDPPLATPPRRGSASFLPAWNSKGYLFPQGTTNHEASLRHDMVQLGVCKLDRLLLKSNGNMVFRDQHADILSRWMYPIAYVTMMFYFYMHR